MAGKELEGVKLRADGGLTTPRACSECRFDTGNDGYFLSRQITRQTSVPSSGVTQEVLCPFMEGEQEQSGDDCLEAECAAPFIHYAP